MPSNSNPTCRRRAGEVTLALAVALSLNLAAPGKAAPADEPKGMYVDEELVGSLIKEVKRLEARAERETTPRSPKPSEELAFYLLSGLALNGVEIKSLSREDRRTFGLENGRAYSNRRLFRVSEKVRVALIDCTFCARPGTATVRIATLFVRRDGKWVREGTGRACVDG